MTSLVTGGNESVGRMIDCISGYATVQFVVRLQIRLYILSLKPFQGIYPTLMIVVLRESVWNASDDGSYSLTVSSVNFAPRVTRHGESRTQTADSGLHRVEFSSAGNVTDARPSSPTLGSGHSQWGSEDKQGAALYITA